MKRAKLVAGYKIVFALLGLSAVITEFVVLQNRGTLQVGNFFSYFTVENNILFAGILLLSARYIVQGKHPGWLDTVRAASAIGMLLVGIGFTILLSGLQNTALTAVPWDNTVLHYIMPLVATLDYLIDRPVSRLQLRRLIWVLAYPLAYGVYSLVRGHLTGWYPYPFLNVPRNGVAQLVIITAGLMVCGALCVWLATKWSGRRTGNLERS